jgi:hypothetical protein
MDRADMKAEDEQEHITKLIRALLRYAAPGAQTSDSVFCFSVMLSLLDGCTALYPFTLACCMAQAKAAGDAERHQL